MRDQFLVELGTPGGREVADLVELNRLFTAWVETVYHRRPHTETGQPPLERWLAAAPPTLPTPEQLHEAFLWSQQRTVTNTATVSVHGNVYQVDAALVGRHVHRNARPDPAPPPITPTGIDYLRLVEAQHTAELADRLRYADLTRSDEPGPAQTAAGQLPGQLDLTRLPEIVEPAEPCQSTQPREAT